MALLLAAPLLLSSCRDRDPAAPGAPTVRTEFGTGDVRLSLTSAPGSRAAERIYTLRLVTGEAVAAYQGVLRFAPGSLEVVALQPATRGEGEAGELHLDREAGTVRFAAYALERFTGDEILRLVVSPRGAALPEFHAELEYVADAAGRALSAGPERPAGGAAYMLYPNAVGPAFLGLLAGTTANQQLVPGTQLALPVIVDLGAAGSLSVARLRTRLTWDPARMTFSSVAVNPALGWSFAANTSGAAGGSITFTAAGPALAATSTVATANFTTSAGAGGTLVKLLPDTATNGQGVSVLPDLRPRALALCVADGNGLWGDANDDGAVNVGDAQQIARYTVGLSVANLAALINRGDVTADGAVNVGDAQQIARFTVGLTSSPRTNTAQYVPPAIGSITLSPSAPQSAVVGGSLQLDATALDGTGADQTGCAQVAWTSSNQAVATVNASGLVTGIAPGTATITATSGTASASLPVGIMPLPAPVLHGVAAGTYHSCDLLGGQAYCWGGNEFGQLGDGSFTDRDRPVAVAGGHTFASLTANRRHTCGLAADGTAWCWGSGEYGVLGNGSDTGRQNTPVQVSGGLQFTQLTAGQDHTCGLTTSGFVYCWGRNMYGEVGDGTQSVRTIPTVAKGGLTYTDVTAGLHHTCAVRPSGAAYCWGDNRAGQVGDGSVVSQRLLPTPVSGGNAWSSISAAVYSTCAVTADGRAFCWGSNTYGQLGDGTTTDRAAPVLVGGAFTFSRVYAGDTSCGLTAAGAAYCWGLNGQGQVGDGTRTGRTAPTMVTGGYTFTELDPGAYLSAHTCGSTAGGTLCWGGNTHGQLGSGVTTSQSSPVAVTGSFASLATGGETTCATTPGPGTSYCWGANTFGALGDGTTASRITPTALAGTENFTLISAGGLHGCGVNAAGAPWCWGQNQYGQIGDGTVLDRWSPTAAGAALNLELVSVAVGLQHSCGLDVNGAAWCWGNNQNGQLGDNTTTSRAVPAQVVGGLTFASLAVGSRHTCARTAAGVAYCWGHNANGALGDNTTTDRSQPTTVNGGKSFTQLSAGDGHTCGLEADGDAWCWGSNAAGQLGDGSTGGKSYPVAVSGGLTFAEVSAGSSLTCARTPAGAAYCWGANDLGQLGGGTRTEAVASSPQAVAGGRTFAGVTAATNHACGLDGSTAWCWGSNSSGQLGTGTGTGVVTAPTAVR